MNNIIGRIIGDTAFGKFSSERVLYQSYKYQWSCYLSKPIKLKVSAKSHSLVAANAFDDDKLIKTPSHCSHASSSSNHLLRLQDIYKKTIHIWLNWYNSMHRSENMDLTKNNIKEQRFAPPVSVRGMKVLDRSQFKSKLYVIGLKTRVTDLLAVTKHFRDKVLKIPNMKCIADLDEGDSDLMSHKVVLFSPLLITALDSFTEPDRKFVEQRNIDLSCIRVFEMDINYDNWTYDEVLDAVLPEKLDKVGGFSIIGHIVHLNLRENLHDYRFIIGQVILDKIKPVKTVVRKINAIENTFRNFEMEVLAGIPDFITCVKEHGFSYKLNFAKVYWNSRLGTEHQRLVESFSKHDIVYDVFAGVGPFAIPAASKKCIVFANDLNPESHYWLQTNVNLNKVKGAVHLFNMDGRHFIQTVVVKDLMARWSQSESASNNSHIIMNLPAYAIDFLDEINNLISHLNGCPYSLLPTVHCYCFSNSDDPKADVQARVQAKLGHVFLDNQILIRIVRNVAPHKEMLCASFKLPAEKLPEVTYRVETVPEKSVCTEDCQHEADNAQIEEEPVQKKSRCD